MRSLLVVATVLLMSACSSGGSPSDDRADPPAEPRTSAPSSPAGSQDACAEVVAGINAFNQGDFDETVAHFEKAVPRAEAADDGSAEAGLLLDAVRYYATLPPGDYLDAAAGSPEFAKWKAVTLGQCADAGLEPPGSPDDPDASGQEA